MTLEWVKHVKQNQYFLSFFFLVPNMENMFTYRHPHQASCPALLHSHGQKASTQLFEAYI